MFAPDVKLAERDAKFGTMSLSRWIECSFAHLRDKLGEPNMTPDARNKVTTGWIVKFGTDVFTVYSFKETDEYLGEGEGPTLDEFRNQDTATWCIGGKRETNPADFIKYLGAPETR